MKNFLKDILKVKDPEKDGLSYSQARVYLFATVIATLVVIFFGHENFKEVTNLLFYLITIFSGYALTGKGMSHLKQIRKNYKKNK